MTQVALLPVPTATGDVAYRAVAGNRHSQGQTAGAALDALTSQRPEGEAGPLIIVQSLRPDRFFDADQQQRLAELMKHWRLARDRGTSWRADEQLELETLVEAVLCAAASRAAALAVELER